MTTMRWFRTRSRWGSCLALVALALQLALSFGHIHLKDVLGEPHSSASADSLDARFAFGRAALRARQPMARTTSTRTSIAPSTQSTASSAPLSMPSRLPC